MTYAAHFLPDVEEDAVGGYAWYEAKSPGLGEEFLRVFYACASEIPRNPLLYPKPELSDFYNKTSRTGVSPVLRGEMLGQPGRLSYRGLGILGSKNRSV